MATAKSEFVQRKGRQFVLNGEAFFINGWNTYWLMVKAKGQPQELDKVMQDGKSLGLTVCRTWAFNDGPNGLQKSPGVFDETIFKGLDLAVATAKKHGIKLMLALTNNWGSYGGKEQYVQWSTGNRQPGDAFFSDSKCKEYYKNYVKTVLTRVNTITKVAYRDEPAIFAWELMNEPRCTTDTTGNTLNAWLQEMATYVKTIDSNHLLGTGAEGFYGPGPGSDACNPAKWATTQGTDFVRDHKIAEIDFTSIHLYPDHWLAHALPLVDVLKWMTKWISRHIDDSNALGKPLIIGEFNLRKEKDSSAIFMTNRAVFLSTTYEWLFASAEAGGSGVGALFWHLLTPGTRSNEDGFAVYKDQDPEVMEVIRTHSKRLAELKAGIVLAAAAPSKTATA